MRKPVPPVPDPASEQRRADPLALFRQVLGTFFLDNTEEERLALWRNRIETTRFNSYAADVLFALDAIVTDPPEDLIKLLEDEGGITLFHRPDRFTLIPYTFDETAAWLRDQTAQFRTAYEEFLASSEPSDG
jgi:hypothetical protein